MNVLSGLMNPAQMGQGVQQAFMQGREMAQQQQQKNALSAYAMNPNDPEAFKGLAQHSPEYAIKIGADRQKRQQEQLETQRAQLGKVADLLDNSTDEASYQRNLNAARHLQLDVSTAPPNFDPEFVKTQSVIARAVLNNDPELPLIAQEVVASGLQPGSPEFASEIGRILKSKYSTSTTVAYQPGGGAVAYDRASGGITPLIVPGAPTAEGVQTQVINGNTFYNVGGKWFDEMPQGGSVGNGTGGF